MSKSKKRIIFQAALAVVAIFAIPTVSAIADSASVSYEYQANYNQLLGQRQRLMDNRAIAIRNLTQCDSWLKQIDNALKANSQVLDPQKLLSSRTFLLNMRVKFQKDLDYAELSIVNVNKDLAWLEGEMKHFAAMR